MPNLSLPSSKYLKATLLVFALYGCLLSGAATVSAGFLFEVPILERSKISELSDDQLLETYIDVAVEADAVKTFYSKGGFTPREYQSFKDLLRYRIYLQMEFQKRKLEPPSVSSIHN